MAYGAFLNIKALPQADTGPVLIDRGTSFSVTTLTLTTNHKDLLFPSDCKEFAILVNSGTLFFRGTEYGTRVYLAASAVVDNLDGTVSLTTGENHGYTVGDPCTVAGLVNAGYNGTFDVEAGSATTELIITPDPASLDLEGIVVVDATGGKISMAYTGHGFNDGDTVTIAGSDNYDNTYTLDAASTANSIVLTAAYVAETFDAGVTLSGFPTETPAVTAYVDGYRDGSTTIGTGAIPIVAEAAQKVMELWSNAGGATVTIYKWR